MALREEIAAQAVGELTGINLVVLLLGRCNRTQHQRVKSKRSANTKMVEMVLPSKALAAGASLFIGLFAGMEIQGRRESQVPTSTSVQSSEQQVFVDPSKVETNKKAILRTYS